MKLKYGIDIEQRSIHNNIKRLTNQIYKLLPEREEGADWEKPLSTIIVEIAGMGRLILNKQDNLFLLLCKLEGLFILTREDDFLLFRKTIFECLSLMNSLRREICQD